MKKLLAFAFTALVAALMSVCFTSCHRMSDDISSYYTAEDSAIIRGIVQEQLNLKFETTSEFLSHVEEVRLGQEELHLMCSLPMNTLSTIADVVLKENGVITVPLIADEYREHKGIYDAIRENRYIPSLTPEYEAWQRDTALRAESLKSIKPGEEGGPSHE